MSLNNTLGVVAAQNKQLAKSAAYLEAGRIANNKLTQLVGPKLPMMFRGYAEHPLFKVLMANLALTAIQKYKADNGAANKLGFAMVTQAYAETFQSFDIEGLIDGFLSDSALGKALDLADKNAPAAAE